ncbi:hypothetical protein EVJ58_g963 [Rhodofomes roseus]|uniref:V-type proton ATPase subunit G n=1 Tax=Rhodofomes roseus TaxID=34475 RepID=A0A4Y9Z3Q6_9APHY|nr:hypothetical protein EVJ58_g963 [Rhodofomes roseus]
MSAQQSQSIQTLLEAEKEAAKTVQQARQYRVQKLKDARAQAAKEIEVYKRQKEDEFKAFEASEITDAYNKNKDQVVKKLLDRVVLVKPELHRNLKKAQA